MFLFTKMAKVTKTNIGFKGGLLVGKPHNDKNGNPILDKNGNHILDKNGNPIKKKINNVTNTCPYKCKDNNRYVNPSIYDPNYKHIMRNYHKNK